jgi:hypothetical protein
VAICTLPKCAGGCGQPHTDSIYRWPHVSNHSLQVANRTQTPSAGGHMYLTTVCRWPHAADLSLQVVRPPEPFLNLLVPNLRRLFQVATSICRWPHALCSFCMWHMHRLSAVGGHMLCFHLQGPKHTALSACDYIYIHRLCLQVATRTPPPSAGSDMHPTSIYSWPHAPCLHQQMATPTPPPSADGHMLLASACRWPQAPCLCCRWPQGGHMQPA